MFKRNKEGLDRARIEIKKLWDEAVGNTAATESNDEDEEEEDEIEESQMASEETKGEESKGEEDDDKSDFVEGS